MAREVSLVTGASSGIGEAFARRLAKDGRHLVLVARRADRLEALAAEIHAAHRVAVEVVPADLTRPYAAATLAAEIDRRGLVVDWLVNNAAFGTAGRFHELPLERELEQVRLNVEAVVDLTGRFLPGMVARRKGAVVNVSSVGGFAPGPRMAVYAASKAFVTSFSEAIAAELAGTGVHVLCVCPGFTRTEFQSHVDVDTSQVPAFAWMTADAVANEAVAAVGRNGPVLVNGRLNAAMVAVTRLLPHSITTRIVGGLIRPKAA
jgi:short-subunit dehydrogenase